MREAHLLSRIVAHANGFDFPRLDRIRHEVHELRNRYPVRWKVMLVEINRTTFQTRKAILESFRKDILSAKWGRWELGCNQNVLAVCEFSNATLGSAAAIHLSRVDQIHTSLETHLQRFLLFSRA